MLSFLRIYLLRNHENLNFLETFRFHLGKSLKVHFNLFLRILAYESEKKNPKILGFIYGFIFGLIIVIMTITTINNFTDDFRETAFVKNSLIYPYIQDISNKYINKYSPILIESTEEIIEENID